MFEGSHTLSMDSKGRISVPTKHRDALTPLVVAKNPMPGESCLFIYPLHAWDRVKEEISSRKSSPQQRQLMRVFVGTAESMTLDSNGRLLIKPDFREAVNLDKKVILVGQGNKLELWDEATWNALYNEDFDDDYIDMLESISF